MSTDRIAELVRAPCECAVNDAGLAFCPRCAELADLLKFPVGMFAFNVYLPPEWELGGGDPRNHVGKQIRRHAAEREPFLGVALSERVLADLRAAQQSHVSRVASILSDRVCGQCGESDGCHSLQCPLAVKHLCHASRVASILSEENHERK